MTNDKKQSLLAHKDKNIFKSWKTYAIATGVLVIVTGTGLGIYYGVNNNSSSVVRDVSEQDISDAIKNTNYVVTIEKGTEANIVDSQIINAGFIQDQLNGEYKTAFKAGLFNREGKIMVQEEELASQHELNNNDLANVGTINTKIKFTYGEIKGKELNLKITIGISDKQIADAISAGTYQLDEVEINTTVEELQLILNADFFTSQLDDEYKNAFDSNTFKVNTIMVDDRALTDQDLEELGEINTTINYSYGEITGEVNVKITVVGEPNEKNIFDKIIETKFEITTASGISAKALNQQISSTVSDQLPELYKKHFEARKFTRSALYKIVDSGQKTIDDDDLKEAGVYTLWVTFGYGDSKNGNAEIEVTLT